MRKQTSIQENKLSLNGQPSKAPHAPHAVSEPTLAHSANNGDPAVNTADPALPSGDPALLSGDPALPSGDPTAAADIALDALLGRLQTPVLRPGFADRVIHSVQPLARPARTPAMTWASALAAVLALCAGALLWSPAPHLWSPAPHAQDPQELSLGDEASLVAALRSPDLSGDDLALVANLGELLEAEIIANHPLWRDDN